MDGMDYCEECEREHREEVKELMEQLKAKTHECEELKEENQELRNSLSGSLMFRFTSQDKEVARYRKALEEIEEYVKTTIRMPLERKLILDIIRKAKGEE